MMASTKGCDEQLPAGLTRIVDFPDIGKSFKIIKPITDFRLCHDGTPAESRIVFTCKEARADSADNDNRFFILKVKVQAAGEDRYPASGPSTTTTSEIQALNAFHEASSQVAPHLIAWKCATQDDQGPLPGGFISYILMTTLPGESLFVLQYWQLPAEQREAIVQRFLVALRQIRALGIQPMDRGLRNILWDQQIEKCSIIDFEIWREVREQEVLDEKMELQRWGLAKIPLSTEMYVLWHMGMRE